MKKIYDRVHTPDAPDAGNAPLVYHTFFAEYSGNTPEDIVAALHRDARHGTGMDYNAWWAWQKRLWQASHDVPAPGDDDACSRLLTVLVEVGALEKGPRPEKPATGSPAP